MSTHTLRSAPARAGLLLLLLTSTPLLLHAQEGEVVRLSEPVVSTDRYEVFGREMQETDIVLTLEEAIADFDGVAGNEATFTGTISEVCQEKGCWMIITNGEQLARVTFEGYSFFVPSNSAGRTVRLNGVLREVELTEDEARHYADDARPGSGALISGPRKEYSIEATAVQIFSH